MKLKQFVLVFLFFTATVSKILIYDAGIQDIDLISTAISSVCEELFIEKSINFDVVLYGKVDGHLEDVTNNLIDKIVRNYSVNLFRIEDESTRYYWIEKSSVVLLKTTKEFVYFSDIIASLHPTIKELTFLLYVDKPRFVTVSPQQPTNLAIVNYYMLINVQNTLILKKLILFSQKRCNLPQIKMLNIFNKIEAKWIRNIKSERKFQDLHGCALAFPHAYDEFLYFYDEEKSKVIYLSNDTNFFNSNNITMENDKHRGFIVEVVEIMKMMMNFSVAYIPQELISYVNGEAPIELIYEGILEDSREIGSTGQLTQPLIVLITNKLKFNNYEMFLNIFDNLTWIAILISIIFAYFVIFYMNLRLGTVRIHPRKELSKPVLNILQIVFGHKQEILLRGNFGRSLIILIILNCLLLRISFWSKLVEFQATDMKKIGPKTVKDLEDGNYRVYLCYYPTLIRKFNLNNFQFIGNCEKSVESVCKTLRSTDTNVGFIIYKEPIKPYVDACGESFIISNNFKMDSTLTEIQTIPNTITYDVLNEILWKLTPAGIPQYWIAYHQSVYYRTNTKIVKTIVEKFSVDDEAFVFILWISGCGISTLTFAMELYRAMKLGKIKKMIRKKIWKCWKTLQSLIFE